LQESLFVGIRIRRVRRLGELVLLLRAHRRVEVQALRRDLLGEPLVVDLGALAAQSRSPKDYEISSVALSVEPYGIMLRKDDPAFKKVVDGATAALYTSGEAQKIYDKWFTQKIPPKGLNLNSPISAELKNEFAKPSDSPDPDSYK